VLAGAAAAIVMHHHALTDGRLRFRDTGSALGDHTTRLVSLDDAPSRIAGSFVRAGCDVAWQIAATHARGADCDDDVALSWHRIRKVLNRNASVAQKYEALHRAEDTV
jgi:hypothetical protein